MSNSSSVSNLDELVGLRSAKKVLRSLFSRAAHVQALLLYGAEGAGKTTLARIIAQHWTCLHPSPEGPCGVCQACESFKRGQSVDFHLIEPLPPSNIITRRTVTRPKIPKIDDPLPLTEFLRTRPLYANHKVVLIEDVHRMNTDAASALLQTLEEPSEYARLVLTTSSIGQVLPTLVSRCLAVACELPGSGEIDAIAPGLSEEEKALAGYAPGRMRRVEQNMDLYRRIAGLADSLPDQPAGSALKLAEEFRAMCDELEGCEDTSARHADAEALRFFAGRLAAHQRPDWSAKAIEAHRRIVGNGSAAIVLDALFVGLLAGNRQ